MHLQMVSPSKSIYTAEQAMQWLIQIADALAYMHALDPTVSLCYAWPAL